MQERRPRRSRKLTVEECVILDSQELAKKAIRGRFPIEGQKTNPTLNIGLRYIVSRDEGRKFTDMRVVLTATRTSFGVLRWWFLCPILKNGVLCNRRIGKLYLPPGALYFGCRHCYSLTYKSIRGHDKRVDYLRKNPDALVATLESPTVKFATLLLALKAVSV